MHDSDQLHLLLSRQILQLIIDVIDGVIDSARTCRTVGVNIEFDQVIHSCLVEDTALLLRHVLERLTRDRQDEMFAILRRLLRFVPHLPQHSAFTMHNYLIGYIMFYVRSPMEGSQELLANALSLLVLVNIDGTSQLRQPSQRSQRLACSH